MNGMKYVFWTCLLTALLLVSCEKVDRQKVINSKKVPIDTSNGGADTTGFPDSVSKVILLEDYTGHRCGNCPVAHAKAQVLYNKYPNKIVVLGVHCSAFATPNPPTSSKYTYDFRTQAATDLDNFFGCSGAGLPQGLVNRRKNANGSATLLEGNWESEIVKELGKQSVIQIVPKATLDEASNTISFEAKIKYLQAINDSLSLSVYLVEDSIVAWQTDYRITSGSQDVPNYVHRHVFRKAITATFGDIITLTPKAAKTSTTRTFTIPIDAKWNKKHLSVITFVSKESTNAQLKYKILQANEVKLK
jgi:hypothetical protein